MKSIKVCEYSRSRSFHYDLILQDQASGERSQDQWSSGIYGFGFMFYLNFICVIGKKKWLCYYIFFTVIKRVNVTDLFFLFFMYLKSLLITCLKLTKIKSV